MLQRPLLRVAFPSGLRRGSAMAAAGKSLSSLAEVEIDPDGTFKYILVRVQGGPGEQREIVRGTAAAEFHNHIFEKVSPEMEKLGFVCSCLGGGKIEHNSKDKKIRVFGLSTLSSAYAAVPTGHALYPVMERVVMGGLLKGYGKADHSVTVELLKKTYIDYEISWSDDKK